MNEMTVQQRRAGVVEWLNSERIASQVARALPDHLPVDWFVRCAQTALLNTPALADADKASLLRELVAVAQLGLVLDPQLAEAYLIVDGNKKVQRRVGYQGLRKLVLQSKMVGVPSAQAVYEHDRCEIELGDEAGVRHSIDPKVSDRGKLLGCWARAKNLATDETLVEWMSWPQIEAHRDRYSDSYKRGKSGPWGDPLGAIEMARKTVLRRLCKHLPKDARVADALSHEDRVELARDVTPSAEALPAPNDEVTHPLAPQIAMAHARPAEATTAPPAETGATTPDDDGPAGGGAPAPRETVDPDTGEVTEAKPSVTVLGTKYTRIGAALNRVASEVADLSVGRLRELEAHFCEVLVQIKALGHNTDEVEGTLENRLAQEQAMTLTKGELELVGSAAAPAPSQYGPEVDGIIKALKDSDSEVDLQAVWDLNQMKIDVLETNANDAVGRAFNQRLGEIQRVLAQ